jgi:putative peptide zinc metalloprotease protein
MNESLFSPHWYRIANLHPQLRPHVRVRRQTMRGQLWYVLHNEAGQRFHRVNERAYELIGRLDGQRSVGELWSVLIKLHGDAAPSQSEVIRILGQLTEAGLVQAEVTPDVRALSARREQTERRAAWSRMNPLSFRLPLFDPTALLERCDGLAHALLRPAVLWLWLALVLAAGGLAWSHRGELVAQASALAQTPRSLLWVWLVYPLMKLLHELGHGLALRRFDCESHEVGVSFMLLMPLPYIDASSAHRLSQRSRRALVSGAGIMVELALAALALLLWLNVEDSWLKDAAFAVMSLGGLSTLLFNGNPLMRYDGYYLLSDALDLPNLAAHSAEHWRGLVTRGLRRALRLGTARPDDADAGDARRFDADGVEAVAWTLYSPLSWAYRVVLSASLVFWLADHSALLALGLGVWLGLGLVVTPLQRAWAAVQADPDLGRARGKTLALATAALAVLVALIGWVPWSSSVLVQGVVWPGEQAQVRAASDGQVLQLLVHDGQRVRAGEPLVALGNPELAARLQVAQARVQVAQAQLASAYMSNPLEAGNAQAALERDQQALEQIQTEFDSLTLRAGRDGVFVLPQADDWAQRHVLKGTLIGYVIDAGDVQVRAAVSEQDVGAVRARVRAVSVRLDEAVARELPGRVAREVPAAANQLPSPALAERNGGPVATDPDDKQMTHTLAPLYLFDVALPGTELPRLGGRVYVRFDLAPQTLWQRLAWRGRQIFLRHFADQR